SLRRGPVAAQRVQTITDGKTDHDHDCRGRQDRSASHQRTCGTRSTPLDRRKTRHRDPIECCEGPAHPAFQNLDLPIVEAHSESLPIRRIRSRPWLTVEVAELTVIPKLSAICLNVRSR